MAGTRDCGLDTSAETGDGKQLDDYFTLTDLVQGNTLVAKPSPLQIIRNPAVPDLFAVVTNVVCTYKIVGPKGEKLSLNRQAVADVARVKMGLSCDFKKPGALTTNFTIHGADHHPKPMMYHTSATHQLAAHTPEDALLVAHTFTHELSKLFGIRVRPSPINIHNIVTVMDAGRRLNRDLITEVTHGYVSTDDIASKSKNTRKRFPGQIVYSRRVPPVVFLFFESGQVTSCGAMTREHVQIGLEEVDEILQKQLQLAIRANPDDLQLARSTRDVINKEQSLAHANKLIARTLSTPHKRPEQFKLGAGLRSVMPGPSHYMPGVPQNTANTTVQRGRGQGPVSQFGARINQKLAAQKQTDSFGSGSTSVASASASSSSSGGETKRVAISPFVTYSDAQAPLHLVTEDRPNPAAAPNAAVGEYFHNIDEYEVLAGTTEDSMGPDQVDQLMNTTAPSATDDSPTNSDIPIDAEGEAARAELQQMTSKANALHDKYDLGAVPGKRSAKDGDDSSSDAEFVTAATAPAQADKKKASRHKALKHAIATNGTPKRSSKKSPSPKKSPRATRTKAKRRDDASTGYKLGDDIQVWNRRGFEGVVAIRNVQETKDGKQLAFRIESKENQVIIGEIKGKECVPLTPEGLRFCLKKKWTVLEAAIRSAEQASVTHPKSPGTKHKPTPDPERSRKRRADDISQRPNQTIEHDVTGPPPAKRSRVHGPSTSTSPAKATSKATAQVQATVVNGNALVEQTPIVQSGGMARVISSDMDSFGATLNASLLRMNKAKRATFFVKAMPKLTASQFQTGENLEIQKFAVEVYRQTGKALHQFVSSDPGPSSEAMQRAASVFVLKNQNFDEPPSSPSVEELLATLR